MTESLITHLRHVDLAIPDYRAPARVLHPGLGPDRGRERHRHRLPGRRGLARALHHPAPQGRGQAPRPGLLRRGDRGRRGRAGRAPDRAQRQARRKTRQASTPRAAATACASSTSTAARSRSAPASPPGRTARSKSRSRSRSASRTWCSTRPTPTAPPAGTHDVLDFRLSDTLAGAEMGTVMNFMRCNARHHSLAFARGPHVSLHHVSFELRGIDEFMRGTGRVLRNGTRMVWGPGRHLAGSNTFAYFLDPQQQHGRVHHRAPGARRGRLAPAHLRHARPVGAGPVGDRQPDERAGGEGVIQRPRPRPVHRPARLTTYPNGAATPPATANPRRRRHR